MDNIPIVDAHHHLWDLNNENTKYSWLMVTEGEAFFGDYGSIRKSYLLEDYLEDSKNQNIIKSVHVQAEHDDDKPVNETAWLQNLADSHSSKLPNAIVAYADFSKNNVSAQHVILIFERKFCTFCFKIKCRKRLSNFVLEPSGCTK